MHDLSQIYTQYYLHNSLIEEDADKKISEDFLRYIEWVELPEDEHVNTNYLSLWQYLQLYLSADSDENISSFQMLEKMIILWEKIINITPSENKDIQISQMMNGYVEMFDPIARQIENTYFEKRSVYQNILESEKEKEGTTSYRPTYIDRIEAKIMNEKSSEKILSLKIDTYTALNEETNKYEQRSIVEDFWRFSQRFIQTQDFLYEESSQKLQSQFDKDPQLKRIENRLRVMKCIFDKNEYYQKTPSVCRSLYTSDTLNEASNISISLPIDNEKTQEKEAENTSQDNSNTFSPGNVSGVNIDSSPILNEPPKPIEPRNSNSGDSTGAINWQPINITDTNEWFDSIEE